MADDQQAKRKLMRGRTAPMHTIDESLRHLQQAHQAVGTHPSSRDVLCQALGHKPGSGTAQVKIGAMSHFGLLRARKGGTYEITPLAQRVLMPHDESERRAAIAEAARTPTLYAELISHLAGKQVPKLLGNLLARNYGVAARQADEFAERFRATMEFAGLLRNGVLYAEPAAGGAPDDTAGAFSENVVAINEPDTGEPPTPVRVPSRASGTPTEQTQEYTIPLGRDGKLAIIQVPVPVQEGYLKRIESWASYMRSVLEDDSGADVEESPTNP